MKQNFSEEIKRILSSAREIALQLGHGYLGTEHLLLGLLQKKDSANTLFLKEEGVDFALAHNGVLSNDDTLRKTLNLPKTKIETEKYRVMLNMLLGVSLYEGDLFKDEYEDTDY